MKIRMTRDYSDRDDHPRKGEVLEVADIEYSDDGCHSVEIYFCRWKGTALEVYPDECEEVL